jgi:hypothetical protein
MARKPKTHVVAGETSKYLTIIARHPINRGRYAMWQARCNCGQVVIISTTNFRAGHSCNKCGQERSRLARIKKERLAAQKNATFRKLWDIHRRMMKRCYDRKHEKYRWYGQKGIEVCVEWHVFSVFRAWAMEKGYEHGLTIERRNPRLNYCPSNCEWITKSENSRRARLFGNWDAASSGVLSFGA